MIRGSTPKLTYKLPFSSGQIKSARIMFKNGPVKMVKTLKECATTDDTISVSLTQEETLKFNTEMSLKIQLQVLTTTGKSLVTPIQVISVEDLLEDGVLT